MQVLGGAQGGTYLQNVTAMAGGGEHSMALTSAGVVYAWGYGGYGQLGNNSTSNSSTAVQVQGVGGSGVLSNVMAISAGSYHSLALTSAGAVFAWGYNGFGQLGNNSVSNSSTPVQVLGGRARGNLSIECQGHRGRRVPQPGADFRRCRVRMGLQLLWRTRQQLEHEQQHARASVGAEQCGPGRGFEFGKYELRAGSERNALGLGSRPGRPSWR